MEVKSGNNQQESLDKPGDLNSQVLRLFGFRLDYGSAHTARTMMFKDLRLLFSCVRSPDSTKSNYLRAIVEDNCLRKRSEKSRVLTGRHLVYLYSLDPGVTVFRVLRFFWERDVNGQPLLALLCAYGRDSLLRLSAPFILARLEGATVGRQALEEYIEKKEPDRFSTATLKSVAQNLNATFTDSGHLSGKAVKTRIRAVPTAGVVAYALFLGYLAGYRGESLFTSEYMRLLDCSFARCVELAEESSRRDWITFKHIGKVMEVQFPNLLTDQEEEWIRE